MSFRHEVGEAVYRSFTPSHYGLILAREMRDMGELLGKQDYYLIRWKDGSEEWLWGNPHKGFKSLDKLIADHEKKLRTHKRTLEKAKGLSKS